MRMPKYLSPTAVSLWNKSREEYYVRYLADTPPPREPQTKPMCVGSAFDVCVKDKLAERFGSPWPGFDAEFARSVEPQNRDFALEAGRVVWKAYEEGGGWKRLLKMIGKKGESVELEKTVVGSVQGVPVLGKVDLLFDGVIHDWKVNGYCSNGRVSPMAGYLFCDGKGMHKDCMPMYVRGTEVGLGVWSRDDWKRQLHMYNWVIGGGESILSVDQLVCNVGEITTANHRCLPDEEYGNKLKQTLVELWETVDSGWIFRDVSEDESWGRQTLLDKRAAAWARGGGAKEEWAKGWMR